MKKNVIPKSLILLFLSLGFIGCLTPIKTDYSIKYYLNPTIEEQKGEYTGLTIGIRGLEVSRSITSYITFLEQGKLYSKEGLEWAEHPVEVIEKLILKSMEKTGRFQDISKTVELKNPDLVLTGEVEQFYCIKEGNIKKVLILLNMRIRETKTSKNILSKEFVVERIFEREEQINEVVNKALSDLSQQIQKEVNKTSFQENIIR